MTQKKAITNDDIMQALGEFANTVQEQFDELRGELRGVKSDVSGLKADVEILKENDDRILTILDADSARIETDDIERLSLSRQVDRHEDWIVASAKAKAAQPYHPGAGV